MIISRTPLRISFAGGGSDLPDFYRRFGGAVFSTSINKFVYVTVNRKFDEGIRVAYSKTEEVESVAEIEHRLVRSVLEQARIEGGVEITTVADIPSRGTGLGSSSSFTVALLHALHAHRGNYMSRSKLAEESCRLEIEVCGEPIGKQDQYAAAFGGLNLIEFNPDETVRVSPIICSQSTIRKLQENLLLLYTGITRNARAILTEQTDSVRENRSAQQTLQRMVGLCYLLCDEMQRDNVEAFGEVLHEGWQLKKSLSSKITTSEIDSWYETARRRGATGGKLLGAGAGGFLLLYANPERHDEICQALPFLRRIPIEFDRQGSQIIFYNPSQEGAELQAAKPLRAFSTAAAE